ncbi:SDR family NAD(P)-dependent oxidoreductase [Ekhidna sp.]|uniref:SDR family NAD(P)-dependent oxidoreductase n=1 Tax=Ekhidna sp. TaxID=2608089 RepID=UPI003514ADA8
MTKNYIVVGGSSGIGFGLTKQLAEQGHHVTVLSRSKGELESLSSVTHIEYDVRSESSPEINLDSIDGYAYCPGTINLKPFHGLKLKDFLEDFELNVMGAIRTLQPLIKQLKQNKNSSVLFFSTVAVQQGMPFHSSVATSKGALEGLTRSLAAELAPHVRVNCIAPSITDTPLAGRILSTDEKKQSSGKRHPLNRVGTAKEVARLATFLLSDESSWMTGQIIGLDGGMSAVRPL